jgi:hypothetical protein
MRSIRRFYTRGSSESPRAEPDFEKILSAIADGARVDVLGAGFGFAYDVAEIGGGLIPPEHDGRDAIPGLT